MTRPSWANLDRLPRLPERKQIIDTVTAPTGRRWTVTRTPEWVMPDGGSGYEVDEAGSRAGAVIVFGGLALLWVALLVWMPVKVHVPWYFVVAGVALLAILPIRWWVRRPWSIVVEAPTFGEDPPERRVLVARGRRSARRLAAAVVDRVKFTGRLVEPEVAG